MTLLLMPDIHHVYQNPARGLISLQFLGTLSQISEEWCLQVSIQWDIQN